MMKQTINIKTAVVKVGKSGKPFVKVNDEFYVFDKEMRRTFEDNIGKNYEVEIDDSTDFHKIKKIYEEVDDNIDKTPVKPDFSTELEADHQDIEKFGEKADIKAKIILLLNQL